jgi:Integrase core domain
VLCCPLADIWWQIGDQLPRHRIARRIDDHRVSIGVLRQTAAATYVPIAIAGNAVDLVAVSFEFVEEPSKLWLRRHAPIARHGHPAKPTAPASPWQNGFVERLIGSIRRECVDHIIVLGEMHLRQVLKSYADYYNRASEHPSVYVVEEKRLC